jgi:murein L,D-transpeptidase YafK
MVKIFVLIVCVITLQADDLTTLYRTQGLYAVKQALDKSLMSRDYWLDVLKKEDTRFGYFESLHSFLSCNKGSASLQYYERNTKNRFEQTNAFDALTGKMDGDKQTEGDHRTPTGIYSLTKKLKKLDPFYGPLAYVTSYPNLYDKIRGKNGSGIWIHGVPNNQTRETFTKGCIALENNDIKCLDKKLDFKNTLLIIDEKSLVQTNEKNLSILLSSLFKWRYAWLHNDTKEYLSFYDPTFKRFDGMDIQKFKAYKTRIFKKNESKQIRFSDLIVLPYPGVSNTYLIRFNEDYNAPGYRFNGEKTLIVTLQENSFSILTER